MTVPVGAALQMVVLPPGVDGAQVAVEAIWARWLVWLVAALTSLGIIVHHRRARPANQAADSAVAQNRA